MTVVLTMPMAPTKFLRFCQAFESDGLAQRYLSCSGTSSLPKEDFYSCEDASLIGETGLRRTIDSRRPTVRFFSFAPSESNGLFQQTAKALTTLQDSYLMNSIIHVVWSNT